MGSIPVVYCEDCPKILALIWEMGRVGRLGWGVAVAIVKGGNGVVLWEKMAWSGVLWTKDGVVVAGLACGREISTWVEAGMFGSVGSYGVDGGSAFGI